MNADSTRSLRATARQSPFVIPAEAGIHLALHHKGSGGLVQCVKPRRSRSDTKGEGGLNPRVQSATSSRAIVPQSLFVIPAEAGIHIEARTANHEMRHCIHRFRRFAQIGTEPGPRPPAPLEKRSYASTLFRFHAASPFLISPPHTAIIASNSAGPLPPREDFEAMPERVLRLRMPRKCT